MMFVIPTWLVVVRGEPKNEVYRVPETKLNDFLEVLTFNKREFIVQKEAQQQAQVVSS